MRNIKKFENESAYDEFKASEDFVTPNVSWCVGENIVKWNPYEAPTPQHDYSQDYLTIVSTSDNNVIGWKASNASVAKTISVSTDDGSTWTDLTSDTTGVLLATLNNGDKMLVKGNNATYGFNIGYNYNYFTSTGNFNVEGNIMSLCYGDNFVGQTTLSADYTFCSLFKDTNITNAINLILPTTTLAFRCYFDMFHGCTSLTTAPALPATTLAQYCYSCMFWDCTALTTAPELSATTLAINCYQCMFHGCTSLTTAPVLPATTLVENCYGEMFVDCTSLTTAPTLPATTLASGCYYNMFNGCTSLTTAPELLATTLDEHCYQNMFYNCTSLNYIKCLATDISADYATNDWVNGVAATGTFVKYPSMNDWSLNDSSGIPSGWTVQAGN